MYYVIKYSGKFGFIKPWSSVRDGETYSQQFLTPSIIEGMEKKLFPEQLKISGIQKIIRHKLNYSAIDIQQEQTQTRGWEHKKKEKMMVRYQSILRRGVMIDPILYLAFNNRDDAEKAVKQHICLCRNEDVMLPDETIYELDSEGFDCIDGFELRIGENDQSFLVGFNRFNNNAPMYGWLEISGKPVLQR